MFHSRPIASSECEEPATLRHMSGVWPVQLERMTPTRVIARTAASLIAGEMITLTLPGIGPVDARIQTASRCRFTACWSGSSELRLRFLSGWREAA